jgi:PhnB protein
MSPYLLFYGDCRPALDFYSDVFRASVKEIITFQDATAFMDLPVSKENGSLVFKGVLEFQHEGSMSTLVMADSPALLFSGFSGSRGIRDNISLMVRFSDPDGLKIVFGQLAVGGKVNVSLKETGSGQLTGSVIDRYGVCWLLEGL